MVSRLYLCYRWLLSAFFLSTLIHSFTYRTLMGRQDIEHPAAKYWIYLTTWGRIMAVFAFTLDAALVTQRWRRELDGQIEVSTRYPSSGHRSLPLSHQTFWVLSNINCVLSALVAIAYWGFVYDGSPENKNHPLNFENFSGHVLIFAANVIDVLISARPWRCLHGYHSIVFCIIYALFNFTYIRLGGTNARGKHYIYSILNWNEPVNWSTMSWIYTIFACLLIIPIIHMMFVMLYKVRCGLQNKIKGRLTNQEESVEMKEGKLILLQPIA